MTPVPLEIILGTYEEFLLGYTILPKKSQVTQTFANHSHISSVRCVAASGHLLASGGADDRIFIYDLKERREHCILDHHSSTINCLEFTPDGSHLLSGSADGVFALTRVGNWQLDKVFTKAHKGNAILDIAIHHTGKMALTLGSDCSLRTWNLVKGRQAFIINLKSKSTDSSSFCMIRWLPCGTKFALTGGKSVEIWSTETGGMLQRFEFENKVTSCTFLSQDQLVTGHENGHVIITNMSDESKKVVEAHELRVKSLLTSKNSRYLITASSNGEFKVFNTKKDYKEMAVGKTGCRITCLCLNPIAETLTAVKQDKIEEQVDLDEDIDVKRSKLKRRVVVEVETNETKVKGKIRKKQLNKH